MTDITNPRPKFNMEKADAIMAATATKAEAKAKRTTVDARPITKAKNLRPTSDLENLSTGLRLLAKVAPTWDKYKLSLYRGQIRVSFESRTAKEVFTAMSDDERLTVANTGFAVEHKVGEYFFKNV